MTRSDATYLLIAQSLPADTPDLARLRSQLAKTYSLDAFLLQQRLIGRGPNLLSEGPRRRMEEIAARLRDLGIRCWVIAARAPRFAPLRLRGLRIEAERVSLLADGRTVHLEPHHRVLAVLADLSGEAAAKNLRRLVAQRAYNGTAAPRPIDDATLTKAILRGKPVLDLYRLDEQGRIDAGVRVLPGRFDPQGLGEHATLSAVGNLQAVLNLVRQQTADCRVVRDFGFANLPGCRLRPPGETSNTERDNLAALTCFGWLMADLAPSAAFAGMPTGLHAPLTEALQEALQDDPPAPESSTPVVDEPTLPPPPPRDESGWTAGNPRVILSFVVAVGAGLLSAGRPNLLEPLFRSGVRTGILPALLTGACLWGFFHYLSLKRHVQNTPTSKVRSMALGLVELQGRAVRKYALVSPVSQLSCVYFRLRKYRRDSKNRWRLTHTSDSGHVPFFLEDETGRVMVNPRGASVSAHLKQESYGESGGGLFGLGTGRDEKWVEEVVAEGSRLYVLGQARERRASGNTLRERVGNALRELKRDSAAMHRYDADGDGHIGPAEWEQARASVERQILEQSLASPGAALGTGDRVIIEQPKPRSLPFVIAEAESETHLLRNYTLLTLPLLAGAVGGLIWTLVTLQHYLQP